jgi:hypothetical protein
MSTHYCPFPECRRAYQSNRALRDHISSMRNAIHDEAHPRDSPHFSQPIRRSRPKSTPSEKRHNLLEKYRRYNEVRRNPKVDYLQEAIKDFKLDWEQEACALKTPHWETGWSILKKLLRPGTITSVEPSFSSSKLFTIPPTFEHVLADLRHAGKENKFTLIDSRTSKPGISSHEIERLLECITAVEQKTFEPSMIHYSMRDMDASPDGLLKCLPEKLDPEMLTSSNPKRIIGKHIHVGANF